MTASSLRFRSRHVHHTLALHLEAELTRLGWAGAGAINFGTVAATFVEIQPDEAGDKILPNTIAITLGDEPAADDEEMGDGSRVIAYPLFVDVYGENQSIAVSIASDVKHLLEDLYLPVLDYTTSTSGTSTEEYLELDKDDLLVQTPPAAATMADFRRYWRVVKTIAQVHYVQA